MALHLLPNGRSWLEWPLLESFIFLILLWPITAPGRGNGYIDEDYRIVNQRQPYIQPPLQLNLTVPIGETAYLHCPVKYLGDKTVSWIRRSDLQILTSGNHIFTSDPRVSLLRESGSWTLRIEALRLRDDSPYECQINTDPKTRLSIFLAVIGSQNDEWVAPLEAQVDYRRRPSGGAGGEARVLGPSVLRPRMGAVVDLTCLVYHSVPSPNITWFRSGTEIKGRSAGGLKISTTRGPSTTVSTLRIHGVNAGDEGKYSCAGEGLNSTSAVLLSLLHQTTDWNHSGDGKGASGGRLDTNPHVSNFSTSRTNGLSPALLLLLLHFPSWK